MTSILTNGAAISALQTLRLISSDLDETQRMVSSGMRVGEPSDNAAYWSISTTMHSEKLALGAVEDAIGLGQAILDVAYAGMEQILHYTDEVKKLVVLAADLGPAPTTTQLHDWEIDALYEGSPHAKIDKQIRELFDAMQGVVDSASFNGVNLLKLDKDSPSVQSSVDFVTGIIGSKVLKSSIDLKDTVMIAYNRTGDYYADESGSETQGMLDGKIRFVTYDQPITFYHTPSSSVGENSDIYVLRSGLAHFNHIPGYNNTSLGEYYNVLLNSLEERMEAIRSGMSTVGSMQNSLRLSEDLTHHRIDNITKGIGRLVDVDMNEASTRLKALQAQQQLVIQSLSIANTTPEYVAQLFR